MAKRVVCVVSEDATADHESLHVTAVGVGSIEGAPEYEEPVETVREHLERGDRYYANLAGDRVDLEAHACDDCGFETVRVVGGEEGAANLDALPAC